MIKNYLVAILMIALTILIVPIPYGIEKYFAMQRIEVWSHFPGIMSGIIWAIGAWGVSRIIIEKKQTKEKTFTFDELKAFGVKLILTRLRPKYLSIIDSAKDKKASATKIVNEIVNADNKYK